MCLPRDPAFTNKDFKRETGQERDLPQAIHILSLSEIGHSSFWPRIFLCEKSRTFICKNLASAIISQKTREANHNKRCDLEVE